MAFFKIVSASSSSVGYSTIELNGTPAPQEPTLNFVGANITVTDNPGNNSTDVAVTNTPTSPWVNQASSLTMVANTSYNTTSASLVTLTLPSTCAFGAQFQASAFGTGGWAIAQAAGQTIHYGHDNTTAGTGGSLASTVRYDTVTIFCSSANTDFTVVNSVGNLTVV